MRIGCAYMEKHKFNYNSMYVIGGDTIFIEYSDISLQAISDNRHHI